MPDLEIDRLQQRLQQVIERSGEAWLTTTVLHGRRALRVNVNSFLTEQRHIDDLLESAVAVRGSVVLAICANLFFVNSSCCSCSYRFCPKRPTVFTRRQISGRV